MSEILDERKSDLAADPVLAELAERVAAAPDPESDEAKRALLNAVDSRELSGAAEAVQYFVHRFRWSWLREEVERRHLDSLTRVDHRLIRHYERMLEACPLGVSQRHTSPNNQMIRRKRPSRQGAGLDGPL
ncbi:hypothetical protein [Streptomyces pseudovenezuelae]|uniref:hypothetical protein n=1 Tax=Streptomyces pseudovenezuelae TaxID=67350 RepID=UPI002E3766F9|nr:hypothetical protein [Streptomyces pseudovenezuelae]